LIVQRLGLALSIGIGIFSWRWEQSQLPKRSGLFRILNDGSSPEKIIILNSVLILTGSMWYRPSSTSVKKLSDLVKFLAQ
jgi:hypothetical protein